MKQKLFWVCWVIWCIGFATLVIGMITSFHYVYGIGLSLSAFGMSSTITYVLITEYDKKKQGD